MNFYFTKYKTTTGLFYKRIEQAVVTKDDEKFKVSIFPLFNYSGEYHIVSAVGQNNDRVLYLTIKGKLSDTPTPYNQFFISISHDKNKFMIFDKSNNGLIFKR